MAQRHDPRLILGGAAALLILIFGTMYGVVQQSQRLAANSPQIQMAEDVAAALNGGSKPAQLVSGRVDMNRSLAAFTIIYSRSGQPIAGSGYLDGKLPNAPIGVLKAATGKDYSFVSWQPEGSLRFAAVTTAANDYYVLSGRSLKEVEKNEHKTFALSFLGGLASLIVVTAGYAFCQKTSQTGKK